jgi:hypothetical protein
VLLGRSLKNLNIDVSMSYLRTDAASCFLCGSSTEAITQEHVFPKWLQRRYRLWDQKIGLLNGTLIPYRYLQIPCCVSCNNEDLSALESTISTAVTAGYEACAALDQRLLYLWVGKLFYGILRKEIILAVDRSRPGGGTILPASTLEGFSNLHLFLQGIRGCHQFSGDPPYSVIVCNLHDLRAPMDYCFRDNLFYLTAAMRMGDVGIMVVFEDAGLTTETYGRYVSDVNGRKLHPLQFDELYARVTYQASLIEQGLSFVTSKVDGDDTLTRTVVINRIFVRERSEEEFSRALRLHVEDWFEGNGRNIVWFASPNLVPTWMTDDSGKLLLMSAEQWSAR